MKQILYLLKYNNYYNRIIKGYNTLNEYLDNEPVLYNTDEVNFNPGDGVNTTHNLKCGDVDADYMLVYTPENDNLQRWFIIDMTRLAGGQYHLALRRDLIQDYKESLISAPMFVEKAIIQNADDSAIFNNENMVFNQIKTRETLIQDDSKTAWLVGYVPRDAFPTDTNITISTLFDREPDIIVESLDLWEYYDLINQKLWYGQEWFGYFNFRLTRAHLYAQPFNNQTLFRASGIIGNYLDTDRTTMPNISSNPTVDWNATALYHEKLTASFEESYTQTFPDRVFSTVFNNYEIEATMRAKSGVNTEYKTYKENLNGILIKDSSTNLMWEVVVEDLKDQISANDANIKNLVVNKMKVPRGWTLENSFLANSLSFAINRNGYRIVLRQVYDQASAVMVNKDIRPHLVNAPYDMFCIPYGEINVRDEASPLVIPWRTKEGIATQLGQQIAAAVGTDNIYDIQLLPYCPCRHILSRPITAIEPELNIYKDTSIRIVKDSDNNNLSVIIWCISNEIDISISGALNTSLYPLAKTDLLEKKIANETELYRLQSPNYNGAFDFSVQKNDGIRAWNITCTYKPFNPYIKVSPQFNNLYGQDFNDARGLICGGDFSLSRITSAWTDYELRNKTYQASFDRTIENMEVNNAIQREKQLWNLGTGIVSSTISGATSGAKMGGGYGAAAGALVGGTMSAIGGAVDYSLGERGRQEALDFAQDQFGYNLQNIQALPYNLSKVGAFNANNKIFPFLEYYTCTDTEKNALRNKIKYNGMTIMRIGSIEEFLTETPSYIKGKLIRVEDIGDFHVINEIAYELNKGIFI